MLEKVRLGSPGWCDNFWDREVRIEEEGEDRGWGIWDVGGC